jgi:hypothetical protein
MKFVNKFTRKRKIASMMLEMIWQLLGEAEKTRIEVACVAVVANLRLFFVIQLVIAKNKHTTLP